MVDHEQAFLKTKECIDVYSTNEPQNAFHQRILYCLNLHNEAVKALRFPNTSQLSASFANADDVREREREITEIVDEEMNGDDDDEF